MKNVYIKNTDQKTWAKIILWAEDIKPDCTKGLTGVEMGDNCYYGFSNNLEITVLSSEKSVERLNGEIVTFPEHEYYPMGKEMLVRDDISCNETSESIIITGIADDAAIDLDGAPWEYYRKKPKKDTNEEKQKLISDLRKQIDEISNKLDELEN